MKKLSLILITGVLLLAFSKGSISINKLRNEKLLSSKQITYKVKKGDNIYKIAEKYTPKNNKVENTVAEIQYLNNINEVIYPGNVLKIPYYK